MAWDFSTEPEFERRLEWMRAFVREEVWPIEVVEDRLTQADLDRIIAIALRLHIKPVAPGSGY